ncbi:peroxiredoxin [Candidatus Fervidibacter sacchari]|uniref:Peroxiredoxin n=1 Tax=Candidatus Fervidibacter sacchari TaxID=1448929 RepID=A0ABT2ENN6_9BACT|nr:peroxiredoxin [Candidatus Fervidibacter sacchari]
MEKEFWRAYRSKGLVVVGVALWAESDPLKMAKMFAQRHKLTYTIAYDPKQESKVAEAYHVEGLPTNIVIGRDGKIRYWRQGFDFKSLKEAVEAALKEPAPKRKKTKK